MALEEYRRKRDFRKTPEPAGAVAAREQAGAGLSFVIQKHAARRLHYDFRLELGGVLKSWAVPKGPSLDPKERRLAVHVEDHPLDYGEFEGIIPPGEYGGGTVLLWDRGTWEPEGDPAKQYEKGHLRFQLHGGKLRGGWSLVRTGRRTEPSKEWLLIKHSDEEARPGSDDAVVGENPLSIASGRPIDAIATAPERVWTSKDTPVDAAEIDGAAREAKIPAKMAPQLATAVSEAPDGDDWLHEIKYDGYRMVARLERGRAQLFSRNGIDWTEKLPEIARALASLPVKSAFIDGEVVHLAADGRTSFSALKDDLSALRTEHLVYIVFDLLHLDGFDLTRAPIEERKDALSELIPPDSGGSTGTLRYSEHFVGDGPSFFEHACKLRVEGIVSKRASSCYSHGKRNRDWLKVKCEHRDEFAVIGWTPPAGAGRTGFGRSEEHTS